MRNVPPQRAVLHQVGQVDALARFDVHCHYSHELSVYRYRFGDRCRPREVAFAHTELLFGQVRKLIADAVPGRAARKIDVVVQDHFGSLLRRTFENVLVPLEITFSHVFGRCAGCHFAIRPALFGREGQNGHSAETVFAVSVLHLFADTFGCQVPVQVPERLRPEARRGIDEVVFPAVASIETVASVNDDSECDYRCGNDCIKGGFARIYLHGGSLSCMYVRVCEPDKDTFFCRTFQSFRNECPLCGKIRVREL